MGDDGALRSCLVTLGAFMLLVWFLSGSLKKMLVTYVFGLVGISGIVLPDWEFFDRDFGQWFSPMPVNGAVFANDRFPRIGRFQFYPLRVALLATIYSYGLYKWWTIMSN